MAEKADRGLAGATEGTVSSFHQRKKQKSSPSSHPSSHAAQVGLRHRKPLGSLVYPQQSTMGSEGTRGSWTLLCPSVSQRARQSGLVKLRGQSGPASSSAGNALSLPPNQTHSEPEESSSTVPALMLMAMGMTPFSCSWRLWRGGGRGGGPFRLLSLAEEPLEEPVPCSRGSLRRLLFSLMVGRPFFLRMPGDREVGALSCKMGHPKSPRRMQE